MRIVLFVENSYVTERHITDRHIKTALSELAVFKTADLNIGLRIDFLCYPSGQAVKFNTRHLRIITRNHTDKVTDTAGRFQQSAAVKAHFS